MNCDLQNRENDAREVLLVKGKAYYVLMVQQTKDRWLSDGDDNIAYFHGLMKKRQYQTCINAIVDAQGNVLC